MVRALKDLPDGGGEEKLVEETANEKENIEGKEQELEEEEGFFDPNLVSRSVVECESKGARIRDLRMLAPSGRQVNVLKMGQNYVYEYYVDFDKTTENVTFGMLFKTVNGIELAGANNDRRKELRIKRIEAGQTAKNLLRVRVQTDAQCLFRYSWSYGRR